MIRLFANPVSACAAVLLALSTISFITDVPPEHVAGDHMLPVLA